MTITKDNIRLPGIGTGRGRDFPGLKPWLTLFCVFPGILLLLSGCGVLKPIDRQSPAGGLSRPQKVLDAVYHDFDDILIPKAMQVDRRLSSVFETSTIKAGVLSLTGMLKFDELIEFFITNMTKDNWTVVSTLKGPRSILQFEKGNRWCVITLADSSYGYKTRVDIWVTPKNDALSSGLLK